MSRYLILAQAPNTARALDAWRTLLGVRRIAGDQAAPEAIIVDLATLGPEGPLGLLRVLVRRLEAAAGIDKSSAGPRDLVVLVDAVRPATLNPLAEPTSWDSLIAQLILIFPEFSWVFGVIHGKPDGFPAEAHELESLIRHPPGDPLFDRSGLRDWVRGLVRKAFEQDHLRPYLPERSHLAFAIDDEPAYAYFNAYAAYRFGFRAGVVDSEEELLRLLGKAGAASDRLVLTFEDLFLNFPDRRKDRRSDGCAIPWSDLAGRSEILARLTELRPLRVFVTTGQRKGTDKRRQETNKCIRRSLKREGRLGSEVPKPLAGIFDLWKRSGLVNALPLGQERAGRVGLSGGLNRPPPDLAASENVPVGQLGRRPVDGLFACYDPPAGKLGTGQRGVLARTLAPRKRSFRAVAVALTRSRDGGRGLAEGFHWPPPELGAQEDPGGSHSAPGKLLEIAGWLLSRAEQILASGVSSVPEAVYGAVLATDALELLGGRTPTTALRALSLKHELEVEAECQFHGVAAHFDVRSRIDDLQREIKAIAGYSSPKTQRASRWSAEAAILGRLIRVFRANEQFDEELVIQVRNRQLHRRMWFKSRRWWGPLGDQLRWLNPAYWAVRYVHYLVASVPRFLLCIVLWVVVLASLRTAHLTFYDSSAKGMEWIGNLAESLTAFFGVNRPALTETIPGNFLYLSMTLIAVVGGVLHFGILVSHLYSLVSRR